jgi:Holliday junction DNA helicase RuvA
MFHYFKGELAYADASFAVIDCCGVGYKLSISLNTYNDISEKVGSEVKLFSHLQVREDAFELYGFFTSEELECFKLLISVSGVGPKAAMSILSIFTPDRFALAVSSEDARALAKASGVGAKTAARIVLELKDKISKDAVSGTPEGSLSAFESRVAPTQKNGKLSEAVDALTVLGYNRSEILDVMRTISPELELEEMITQALKKFASR